MVGIKTNNPGSFNFKSGKRLVPLSWVINKGVMSHFRTIYESKTRRGTNPPTSTIKISEYVPGAVITGTTQPDTPVGVLLNVTSNQGRMFQYFNIGIPQGSRYSLRVPYSTEKRYGTHATDGLMVFSGGRSARVNVSEDDVEKGKTIEVDF